VEIPPELRALASGPITPFLGAGMALEAGIPLASGLAELLVQVGRIEVDDSRDLVKVAKAMEEAHGEKGTQDILRGLINGLPLNSTAPLRALAAGCRGGVILTSNYDDAIEVSTEDAGLRPLPFVLNEALAHGPIGPDEVAVIHVHGRARTNAPLVLPGRETHALATDVAYVGLMGALLAPHPVVYLGFRIGAGEIPLQTTLAFLNSRVIGPAPQFLVVSARDAEGRQEQIEALEALGLTVVTYEGSHEFVSELAQFFAPRAEPLGETVSEQVGPAPEGWVMPRMLRAPLEAAPSQLDQMLFSADRGLADAALPAKALVESTRALLVASPGMGKTELLAALARDPDLPAAVMLDLRVVPSELTDNEEDLPLAIARALVRSGRASRREVPVPTLEILEQSGLLILLDSLDEVRAGRVQVAAAIAAAVRHWPQHRWVVASRPVPEAQALVAEGFEVFRLWPSREWGAEYLDARGIDNRARREMEESGGFDDLISIPLFAAAAAPRLIESDLPERPLDLLVDLQRDAADAEQAKEALDGSLFGWVRRLAVGLELRARATASVGELAAVAGPGAPEAKTLRERLIRSTLLAELPDRAGFARKTFQEALCAEAILAADDIAAALREIAEDSIDGETALRSDIDFTIDLVFENADRTQREALRELDSMRWARTVVSRGSEQDAEEAFDLIWNDAAESESFLSSFADHTIRSPIRAVGAIARKWPEVIKRRRDELIEASRAPQASQRYNAVLALGAMTPDTDDDLDWLFERVVDAEESVGRAAVGVIRHWRSSALFVRMWAAMEHLDKAGRVWSSAILTLARLAVTPEDVERVVKAADQRSSVLRQFIGDAVPRLTREQHLALLPAWPSDGGLWRWYAGVLLADEHWSAGEIDGLAWALIKHRIHLSDIVDQPAIRAFIVEHAEAVVAVVAEAAKTYVSGNHTVFSMLWALPAERRAELAGGYAQLANYLEELDSHVEGYPPPSARTSYEERLLADLDSGAIDEEHPASETHWPKDFSGSQRARLAELAEAWWPDGELKVEDRYPSTSDEERAVAAVSAAAAVDMVIDRQRWLAVMRAPEILDLVQSAYRWLGGQYDSAWDDDVVELVGEAQDGLAVSQAIAVLPAISDFVLNAMVSRLAALGGGRGWSNAVGLLREAGHGELLRPLLDEDLGDDQRRTVIGALAQDGDADAQVAVLEDMIERARAGEKFDGVSWRQAVSDPRVVELLGELILALPSVGPTEGTTYGYEPRSAAEGMLAVATTEQALKVYDRLIAEDTPGHRYDLSRAALLRRLVAERVLARLPEDLPDVAKLLLDEA